MTDISILIDESDLPYETKVASKLQCQKIQELKLIERLGLDEIETGLQQMTHLKKASASQVGGRPGTLNFSRAAAKNRVLTGALRVHLTRQSLAMLAFNLAGTIESCATPLCGARVRALVALRIAERSALEGKGVGILQLLRTAKGTHREAFSAAQKSILLTLANCHGTRAYELPQQLPIRMFDTNHEQAHLLHALLAAMRSCAVFKKLLATIDPQQEDADKVEIFHAAGRLLDKVEPLQRQLIELEATVRDATRQCLGRESESFSQAVQNSNCVAGWYLCQEIRRLLAVFKLNDPWDVLNQLQFDVYDYVGR